MGTLEVTLAQVLAAGISPNYRDLLSFDSKLLNITPFMCIQLRYKHSVRETSMQVRVKLLTRSCVRTDVMAMPSIENSEISQLI